MQRWYGTSRSSRWLGGIHKSYNAYDDRYTKIHRQKRSSHASRATLYTPVRVAWVRQQTLCNNEPPALSKANAGAQLCVGGSEHPPHAARGRETDIERSDIIQSTRCTDADRRNAAIIHPEVGQNGSHNRLNPAAKATGDWIPLRCKLYPSGTTKQNQTADYIMA